MTCPNCTKQVEESIDQSVATTAVVGTGLAIAAPGILGMIVAPYLAPILAAGLLWSALRKVTCPGCGHRFTCWQSGSN